MDVRKAPKLNELYYRFNARNSMSLIMKFLFDTD